MWKRVTTAIVVTLMMAALASAQTPSSGAASQQPTTSPQGGSQPTTKDPGMMMTSDDRRPATTTHMGDTGLWFVPTGEVLPARKWSFSLYRVNFDYNEGFTDVSNWPVTFGVGLGDRAELFAAVHAVRRIDRDARPLYFGAANGQGGGVVNDYPFISDGWSGNQFGDVWIGGKVNLASQWRQNPLAFGIRGLVKLPTAKDDEEGVGTGKPDFAFDAIL